MGQIPGNFLKYISQLSVKNSYKLWPELKFCFILNQRGWHISMYNEAQKYFDSLLNNPKTTIALVGATNDRTKYGNIILKNLTAKNFEVYPINPKASAIDGIPAYPDLTKLPQKPDIVNFVVPAKLGLIVLRQALEINLDNFWFQPGAESEEIISVLRESGKHYLADGSCIMVMAH